MPLWTPADLSPAPWGWYDFSSASNVTLNGSSVSQITNRSGGSGPTLPQATAAKQPSLISAGLNGLNHARFDGVDDALSATATWPTGALTMCAVYKDTTVGATTSDFVIANAGSGGGANRRYIYTGGTDFGGTALVGSNVTANQWNIAVATVSGSGAGVTQSFFGNGNAAQTGTVTSNASNNNLTLAAYNNTSFYNAVDIAEIIIIGANVSTADRKRIEGYLAHKWGLTANLPSGHTYKTTAPEAGAATGAVSIAGPTLSGSGAAAPPAITGTAATSVAGPSLAGSGAFFIPNSGDIVISGPAVSGSGAVAAPPTRPWVPTDLPSLHRWYEASNSYVDTTGGNLVVADRTGVGPSLYAAGKSAWYTSGLVASDATSRLTARRYQTASVNLPDVGPNNVGSGFTNTGLCYHPGRNSLFIGDDGRPGSGLGSPQNCGVVEVSLDGTTVIQHIPLFNKAPISGYPDGSRSVQGVAYDSVNGTIWAAVLEQSILFEINPSTGQLTGTSISLSHQANGLAFDPAGAGGAGTFWTLDGSRNIREVNRSGTNLKTYAAVTPNVPDHLTFDPVHRVIYATSGSNGADGEVTAYRADDGAPLGTYAILHGTLSVEGIVFVGDQLICCSDEDFHGSGINKNRLAYFNARPDPLTDGVTLFWVGKVISQSVTAGLFGYGNATAGTGAGLNVVVPSSTQLRLITNSNSGTSEQKIYNVGTTTNRTRGVWSMSYNRLTNVYTVRFNGALYGTLTGSSGVSDFLALTGFVFGDIPTVLNAPISADFSEIVGVSAAAAQADIEKGEGYLAHKYTLAGDLDAAHPYKAAAPETFIDFYTGPGSVAVNGPALSGSGVAVPPAITGAGAVSIGAPTGSGSGTVTASAVTGSGSVSIGVPALSGAGASNLPGVAGAGAVAISGPLVSGTGEATTPNFSGSGAVTITTPTAFGSGSVSPPAIAGAGAMSIASPVVSGSGAADTAAFTGSGAVIIQFPAFAGSGSTTVPAFTGAGGVTISGPSILVGQATGVIVTHELRSVRVRGLRVAGVRVGGQ